MHAAIAAAYLRLLRPLRLRGQLPYLVLNFLYLSWLINSVWFMSHLLHLPLSAYVVRLFAPRYVVTHRLSWSGLHFLPQPAQYKLPTCVLERERDLDREAERERRDLDRAAERERDLDRER